MAEKANKTLLWVIVAVLVVLGVVYFYRTPSPESDSGAIKVGVITPLTGDAAVYGTEMQRAYDLAVKEVNESGGVNGRMIELVYEDGKCDGTNGTAAANKLINIDRVQVILGGTCSGETLGAAELTEAAGVLLISPSATSPDITNAGPLVYRTYPSDALEASLFADVASNDLLLATAAVISENTDFAQALRKAFVNDFIEGTRNVVFDEAFNTGETDFRTLVTQMRSQNPDLVYVIPQAPATGELILKQMKELGVRATLFLPNSMLGTAEDAPSLYEGAYFSEVKLDEENEISKKVLAAYEEAYGEGPGFTPFVMAAYDSVMVVTEAMRNGNTSGADIATFLDNNVNDWPGALGVLNLDENGDALFDLSLAQVQGGQLKPVDAE